MNTLNEAWDAGESTSLDDMAAAMKETARARVPAKAAKPVVVAPVKEEKPARIAKPRKPRSATVPAESGAVQAIRREITGHEREIKRLAKALRALGAA